MLSLFDGMSCGREAFIDARIKVHKYYASEIKEDAIKVTQHNHPDTIQLGSVTEINGNSLGNIDILIGGSPCQNLSVAMCKEHRKGLDGDKSSLFYEYYRILKEAKPKYFLLENVGGMDKKDRDVITQLLGVEPININSKLVSAQLRNRLYWTNIPSVTRPKNENVKLNDILIDGWSDREKSRCLLESDSRPLTTPLKMFHRYYSTGFTTLIFRSQEHYVECVKHYNRHFKGMSAKEIDYIKDNVDCRVYNGTRYLYQEELEKLQTIPVGYTSILDRNSAAGLLGDGWTMKVISHILRGIK
ncbi:DNA cytosine methyltransferase [Sporanaerobium hydrogeniformans]|uniref:DNA cytosine methyltransferase n=1 Tax=Sporanaerobium hydrogeniformans TaxID=3072179 RepID=UPI0015D4A352|nr:DNA cytosine methyltransferase [Sporanaerobium hydrogeniformans]